MVYQILVNVINTYNVLIEWYMILIHGLHAVSFFNLHMLCVPIASMHFAAASTVLC